VNARQRSLWLRSAPPLSVRPRPQAVRKTPFPTRKTQLPKPYRFVRRRGGRGSSPAGSGAVRGRQSSQRISMYRSHRRSPRSLWLRSAHVLSLRSAPAVAAPPGGIGSASPVERDTHPVCINVYHIHVTARRYHFVTVNHRSSANQTKSLSVRSAPESSRRSPRTLSLHRGRAAPTTHRRKRATPNGRFDKPAACQSFTCQRAQQKLPGTRSSKAIERKTLEPELYPNMQPPRSAKSCRMRPRTPAKRRSPTSTSLPRVSERHGWIVKTCGRG
jgi:hypothetical protein